MKYFLRALGFLTIFPVRRRDGEPEIPLADTAPCFPLVGLVIGILVYAIFWWASRWLPWRPCVLLLLAGPVILSGGLHVDGLSDFCDGFFSARASREEILRIMKDSRIGVMGALGMLLVLWAKYELLVVQGSGFFVFLFMLAASRTVQVAIAYFLPYAGGESGMAKGFAGHISRNGFCAAVGITAVVGLFAGVGFFIIEAFFLVFFVGLFCAMAKTRLGGVTGDLLGAASELSELLILMVAAGWGAA